MTRFLSAFGSTVTILGRFRASLWGILSGMLLLTALHHFVAVCDLSTEFLTAACVAIAAAAYFGIGAGNAPARDSTAPAVLLAGWCCLLPWVAELAIFGTTQISLVAFQNPFVTWSVALAMAVALVGIPAAAVLRLTVAMRVTQSPHATRRFAYGICFGILLHTFGIAPFIGLMQGTFAAGGLLLLLAVTVWHKPTEVSPVQPAPEVMPSDKPVSQLAMLTAAIGFGLIAYCVLRVLQQLMPMAPWVSWTSLATAIGLAALGQGWSIRSKRRSAALLLMLMSTSLTAFVGCFHYLVHGSLLANAFISSVALLVLVRCAVIVVGVGLPAFAFGAINAVQPNRLNFVIAPLAFASAWYANSGFVRLATITSVTALGLCGAAGFELARSWVYGSTVRVRRAALVACLCLLAVGGAFAPQHYVPARAARLLFSTRVFLAARSWAEPSLLVAVDEGRLLACIESESGVTTAMKYRGAQIQLRENGIPSAVISTAPDVCPDFSAEILTTVVPLAIHENPSRVMFVGMRGGRSIETALGFPTQEVVCFEHDRCVPELVAALGGMNPDERLTILNLPSSLAVAAKQDPFDVIISAPAQASLVDCSSEYTEQWYRKAAARLSSDGIFCQRFNQIDFGHQPMADLFATLRRVFENVTAVEVATGDMLFLGSNNPEGLMRPGLAVRLQRTHVQETLARLGWDWASVLNLMTITEPDSGTIARKANTVANGRFAFRLSYDMMRWADKVGEVQKTYINVADRLLHHVPGLHQEELTEINTRLTETIAQREIFDGGPDQYWLYRKTLRRRMKDHPRPAIEVVENESVKRRRNPVDEHRMEFLRTLSAAQSDPNRIEAVARFATPHDPLISPFAWHEAAELHARSEDPDPAREFALRLHTVYFAGANDRSVRNVVRSLRLLLDHPELISDPLERYDHINGLLQVLVTRWQNRRAIPPTNSNVAMIDIQQSIVAIQDGLRALADCHAELESPVVEISQRTRFLELELVRPLRKFRDQLMAHRQRPPHSTDQLAN